MLKFLLADAVDVTEGPDPYGIIGSYFNFD
jgi:hypothetical protein